MIERDIEEREREREGMREKESPPRGGKTGGRLGRGGVPRYPFTPLTISPLSGMGTLPTLIGCHYKHGSNSSCVTL